MGVGNLGWAEIAVIVVVALVVLGPEKLPGAARQIGNVIRQVRKISTGFQQELQNALDEPIEEEARRLGRIAVEEDKLANGKEKEPGATTDGEKDGPGATQAFDQPQSSP
ncbi:MAG: twin-arginine translocase subunit TatB [Acidimicrobiia bacterium]|nr:twin-arginine translocase subunit TatB [Acidimicrobiia bacterium]MYB09702.1 twin-arginine translocase subunit TatB [Acidimicrobiia bacterium]MYB75477.1 twin-arginine translocase subunit TatB [Acidimicrobiia bacterium]MYG60015.1 twin-arginine translocase subunit TatB [Acidimicrobiia bacterium]MYI00273.1 twin-arginine translocase subunit TatB [Acidimicrobiia bacterium]